MSREEEADLNDIDEPKEFNSPREEILYLRSKLGNLQTEFQEFQESSRELEVEYETQISQLEKKNCDLSEKFSRSEEENEQLKTKYVAQTNDTQQRMNRFQAQISELTAVNDRLSRYIRELEQGNDDLERAKRMLAASLQDTQSQLNQQIERIVLLENELGEKAELECALQRVKEEARDLKQELAVKAQRKISEPEVSDPSLKTQNLSNDHNQTPSPTRPTIMMPPSTRLSALNIVGDLLRKVGALESKLSAAKNVDTNT